MKAAVVTVSDGVSEGTREDESGEVLAQLLAGEGFEVDNLFSLFFKLLEHLAFA